MTLAFHFFLYGTFLGWGAAIPIGPVNLEITRRNLHYGARFGVALGVGACLADLTYLVLLSLGALTLLDHPIVLKAMGIVGALILGYFGVMAFRLHAKEKKDKEKKYSVVRTCLEGYLMTLISPFNVLFWGSISAQIATMAASSKSAIVYSGAGVIFGSLTWVIALNLLVHLTRHRISANVMKWLNRAGGVILIGFALYGLIHALFLT